MNVFEIITNRVLKKIEEEKILPWQKPWRSGDGAILPTSLVSKKRYRGANLWMLHLWDQWDCPYWLSYKQAHDLGGRVRKGEKGFPVVFWGQKIVEKKGGGEDKEKILFPRYYTVFNLMQCEEISSKYIPSIKGAAVLDFKPIEACENVVSGYRDGPEIVHESLEAGYKISTDVVCMPKKESFISVEEYYSTLFHELTHSTGHKKRLKRTSITDMSPFGTTNYSKEELIAEMGTAFLCGITGIGNTTLNNSVAYLNNWLDKFEKDSRLLVLAGAQAQRSVDWILGKKMEEEIAHE